jgi:hypothetical protein
MCAKSHIIHHHHHYHSPNQQNNNFNKNLHVGLTDHDGPIVGVVAPYGDHGKRIGRAHKATQILEFLGRQVQLQAHGAHYKLVVAIGAPRRRRHDRTFLASVRATEQVTNNRNVGTTNRRSNADGNALLHLPFPLSHRLITRMMGLALASSKRFSIHVNRKRQHGGRENQ